MRVRTIAYLVASLLVLVPVSTAVAQTMPAVGMSAPGLGLNNWNDEPNVLAPGCLTFAHDNPSSCYPADNNNLATAKAPGAAPTLVLQSKWAPYQWPATVVGGTWGGVGWSGVFNQDVNMLFDAFGPNDYMTPATQSSFTAFHGYWTDLNQDGFRDEHGHFRNSVDGTDRQIFIDANADKDCTQQAAAVDPAGSTRIAGGQQGNLIQPGIDVPVGVSYKCTAADEWSPPDGWFTGPRPEVVGYLAPWSVSSIGAQLFDVETACPIYALETFEDCVPEDGQQTPNIRDSPGDFYGHGTYSCEEVYDVSTDGSVVQTKVLTTIANPVVSSDGPRSHEVGAGSLVDVDLFRAVDGAVESLYNQAVFTLAGGTVNGALAPVNSEYESTICPALPACGHDVTGSGDAFVGPVQAKFFQLENDVDARNAFDYTTGKHLYLNLRIAESIHLGAQATAFTGGMWGTIGGPEKRDTGSWCGDLSGKNCGFIGRLQVDGHFGAWHDVNGDGFIGNPNTSPGCPDPYDCGATGDPNEDAWAHSTTGTDEWTPLSLQGTTSGHSFVTLTTDDGKWGPVGAYKTIDAESDCNSTQNCRAQFEPYDDIVIDAQDGTVDQLITSGPIRLTVVSPDGTGYYYSWEELIVPGLQAVTGITMTTDPFTLDATKAGTPTTETVQDVDYNRKWLSP